MEGIQKPGHFWAEVLGFEACLETLGVEWSLWGDFGGNGACGNFSQLMINQYEPGEKKNFLSWFLLFYYATTCSALSLGITCFYLSRLLECRDKSLHEGPNIFMNVCGLISTYYECKTLLWQTLISNSTNVLILNIFIHYHIYYHSLLSWWDEQPEIRTFLWYMCGQVSLFLFSSYTMG